jgi:hypothetical protein
MAVLVCAVLLTNVLMLCGIRLIEGRVDGAETRVVRRIAALRGNVTEHIAERHRRTANATQAIAATALRNFKIHVETCEKATRTHRTALAVLTALHRRHTTNEAHRGVDEWRRELLWAVLLDGTRGARNGMPVQVRLPADQHRREDARHGQRGHGRAVL